MDKIRVSKIDAKKSNKKKDDESDSGSESSISMG